MHRLQIIADLAQEYGRRLCFVGRSMFRNSEIAMQMGRLHVREGVLVHPQEISKLPDIRGVGCDRKRAQAFLNLKIVEKS